MLLDDDDVVGANGLGVETSDATERRVMRQRRWVEPWPDERRAVVMALLRTAAARAYDDDNDIDMSRMI